MACITAHKSTKTGEVISWYVQYRNDKGEKLFESFKKKTEAAKFLREVKKLYSGVRQPWGTYGTNHRPKGEAQMWCVHKPDLTKCDVCQRKVTDPHIEIRKTGFDNAKMIGGKEQLWPWCQSCWNRSKSGDYGKSGVLESPGMANAARQIVSTGLSGQNAAPSSHAARVTRQSAVRSKVVYRERGNYDN
jgi:hypothetical protein